jgi:nitrogen fixation protein FixH
MARGKPRQAGWWIPWVFVGGFVVVIGANAGMVAAAFATFTGLTTKNYYRRGLAYNKEIEAEREQRRRGWKATLRLVPTGQRKGRLIASFADRAGTGLLSLDVAVRMVRPTSAGHDFSTVLKPLGDGRYVADIAFPLPGQWRAELLARRGKAQHRLNQHFEIQ